MTAGLSGPSLAQRQPTLGSTFEFSSWSCYAQTVLITRSRDQPRRLITLVRAKKWQFY